MDGVPEARVQPGDTVADRYRVIGELGTGGMGSVFRVEHTMMAKEMAMKLLRPELSGIPEVIDRFEREAKSVARLDHQHIIRVTDFGRTAAGDLFLVMELAEGQALTQYLAQRGRLEPAEAVFLVDQILEALEHAHGHSVIHRDLKPDNVMLVEKEGRRIVKLLDFGLAKITEAPVADGKQLTTAGTVFGTPRYMSPEQAAAEAADHRADLYSVGVMLFELVSGRPPFVGQSTVDVLRMHLTHPPPPLEVEGMEEKHRKTLESVIHKAMEKHPNDRFATATEFRDALASFATGSDPTFVSKKTRIDRVPSFAPKKSSSISRRRVLIGGGAFGLVGAAAILVAALSSGPSIGDLDAALDRGEAAAARRILVELSKDTTAGQRLLYEGHIAYLEGDSTLAVDSYLGAITADPKLELDDRFTGNVMTLVKTKPNEVKTMVEVAVDNAGPSAAPLFEKIFEESDNIFFRRRSYAGLRRLDAISRLDDPVGALVEDLKKQKDRHCSMRKWYVEQLIEADDDRVLEALLSEQGRRGNFLVRTFGGGVNGCMYEMLDAEIAKRKG